MPAREGSGFHAPSGPARAAFARVWPDGDSATRPGCENVESPAGLR